MTRATGTFDVKLSPQAVDEKADASLGRIYVAIERVSGTLHGRGGSFTLQHSGTMTRGAPQLTITVVPDSGTDQLKGLAGKMMIIITDGKHSYDFDYTLAESP